jgi:hypothetical protein
LPVRLQSPTLEPNITRGCGIMQFTDTQFAWLLYIAAILWFTPAFLFSFLNQSTGTPRIARYLLTLLLSWFAMWFFAIEKYQDNKTAKDKIMKAAK